ncbi:MAG: Hint domain-containing protein [Paenirhodobacter sp.]|uniref:Hint domain-containing protein n=1 Tax=Paenirhodobacter sp. TaxID=1965326 RepID=UPI003D12C3F0
MTVFRERFETYFHFGAPIDAGRMKLRRSDEFLDLAQGLYKETVLRCSTGLRTVAHIAEGDLVMTFDHGFRPVVAVERFSFARLGRDLPEAFWPLRLPPGLFGNAGERFVAPDQCLMIESDLAEEEYGDPFVLVPGKVLALLPQVERTRPGPERAIHRLRFERPELVVTNQGAVLLCDTGSFFDDWQNLVPDEDLGQLMNYTALPFEMAADLLRREIRRDGGIDAHLQKHLTRMHERVAG